MPGSDLEHLEFLQALDKASVAVRRATRKAAYSRLKRTEGVTITQQPKAPSTHDPYHRTDEEIAAAREAERRRYPD